jgi:stage V sporulation protein SpoVS
MTFTTKARLSPDGLLLTIPRDYTEAIKIIADRATNKHSGFMTVTLGTPKRPRTTGPRSQNSKVFGMCTDIVEQFHQAGMIDIDVDKVYQAFKRMAVAEGYPTRYNPIDGIEEPESQSRISVEQDAILIKVIQRFADENNMWITDYDEQGRQVRTIGGKPVDINHSMM